MEKELLMHKWRMQGIKSDVIEAFSKVKREDFTLEEYKGEAYVDSPLPIGHDQTISQPSTVIFMIDALDLSKDDVVLEIGAGSGYNAAIMSSLCKRVYTIERLPELCEMAEDNLKKAGIKNVEVVCGDGSKGLEKEAPFDRIILTAACPSFPKPLVKQLKEGGIILAPVGESFGQVMIKARKAEGKLVEERLGNFMFVPLVGEHGFGA